MVRQLLCIPLVLVAAAQGHRDAEECAGPGGRHGDNRERSTR
jgi:hypothetical protein